MPDDLFSVSGQVVLVSGASRGIGRAIAEGFAQRGARVIMTGRDEATLAQSAQAMVRAGGGEVHARVCDVAQPSSIARLVEGTIGDFGHIDTLVNSAGVNRRKSAISVSEEDFDYLLDINLKGAFLLSQ